MKTSILKTALLLPASFIFHSFLANADSGGPPNSHLLGQNWYCDTGFTRIGNKCEKLSVPINAHVLGNSWYCDTGYQKIGNACSKLDVPADAHVLGNSWYCDTGFTRVENKCEKLSVPINAHVLGNSWYCDTGYQKIGNACSKLDVPANAHVLGNSWYCNSGFKKVGANCVVMTAKEKEDRDRLLKEYTRSISDGTKAYKTKIDSTHDDILKLENGGIVEISSGYLGYVGYRKDAVLFKSGSSWKIWIEGKRSFNCDLLKEPSSNGETAKTVYISEVKGDGAIITMSDGSIFEVDSIDHIYTSLWLGSSDALLIDGSELLNLDSGESVTVSKVR